MRAWCWTLPVKMIEVNVSVNSFLNILLLKYDMKVSGKMSFY